MICDHDIAEMETACADGQCPICASAALTRADAENERLRMALQNCRMFFDANNRPNYVAMIDVAMGNEQKGGKDGNGV